MKQYYITRENLNLDTSEDAYLAPDDPIHALKAVQLMGGLGSEARLAEYRAQTEQRNREINKGNTVSLSPAEKNQLMKDHNIKPGSPEYIKLWFSKPGLTGEKPV